jgi:hypothetical protein
MSQGLDPPEGASDEYAARGRGDAANEAVAGGAEKGPQVAVTSVLAEVGAPGLPEDPARPG